MHDLTPLIPTLRRRARRLSDNSDSAEDLLQDVLLTLWRRQLQGQKFDNLQAYAMTCLRNTHHQRLRDRRPDDALPDEIGGHRPEAHGRLACGDLARAMAKLPAQQRAVLQLIAAGEESPREMAYRLGVPRGTVMSRLARARGSLRDALDLPAENPAEALVASPPSHDQMPK